MTMISDEIRIPGTTYYVSLKDRSLVLSLRNRVVDNIRISESETDVYKTLDRLLTKYQVYIPKPTLKDIAKRLLSSYRLVMEEKKVEETVTAKELALRSKMRRASKQAIVINGPKELIKLELSKLFQNEEKIENLLSSYDSAYAELSVVLPNDEHLPLVFTNWNKLLDVIDTARILLLIDSDDTGARLTELFEAIKGFRKKTNMPLVLIIHRDESKERVAPLEEIKQICDSNKIVYYENVHISDILGDLKKLVNASEEQVTQIITELNNSYLGKLIEEKQWKQEEEEERRKREEEETVTEEEEKQKVEEEKKKKGFLSKIFGKS